MSLAMKSQWLRICSSQQMRELDNIADTEYGLDAAILMENAGRSASQIILEQCPHAGRETEVLVFAGKGNNAGDAFVVARRLICMDRRVRVFHLSEENEYHGATLKNFKILKKLKAKMAFIESAQDIESFFKSSTGPFTIVDGILGTGLKGSLDGVFFDLVEIINQVSQAGYTREVIALDIPTGVSGDTGKILGNAIQATLTISFGFPKLGHFLPPGATRRGELINVDISLPSRFRREGDQFLIMPGPLAALIQERNRYGHKNSFGHTLLIGGSPGRLGAISMASKATHKTGTGLVTVATWEDSFQTLLMKLPDETMAVPLRFEGAEIETYKKMLPQYSSVVVGPGMGLREESRILMSELLLRYSGPLVVDADALNVIAEFKLHDYLVKRNAPTVLTPHPGEMARLLGVSKEEVLDDPIESVKKAVKKTHSIVVLKGAATIIGSIDERVFLNHYPNDGMASGGSGDVLAGMIGGLIGQQIGQQISPQISQGASVTEQNFETCFQATLLGVYLHSLAGDLAAKNLGHRSMTAPDIISNISQAFVEIQNVKESPFTVESRARIR